MGTTSIMIIKLLKDGPKTLQQMILSLGLTATTIRNHLRYYRVRNRIKKEGNKFYLVEKD